MGDPLVIALLLFTLCAGVAIGIWQVMKVRKAKREHSHSAMTANAPQQRRTDGAPGVEPQP